MLTVVLFVSFSFNSIILLYLIVLEEPAGIIWNRCFNSCCQLATNTLEYVSSRKARVVDQVINSFITVA